MTHELKPRDHLFQCIRDDWRIEFRRDPSCQAHSLEFLSHDGNLLALDTIRESPP